LNILGLNAFHGDSAAALVVDGKLVAAVEEERFLRVKHWAGFPAASMRYCLEIAGLGLQDIDVLAINQDSGANLMRKIGYVLSSQPDFKLIMERLRNRRKRENIAALLARAFPDSQFRGGLHQVEHHLAHLASAFHVSPFAEALNVSVDGFGDFASAAWGVGRGNQLTVDGRIYFPHSLGIFYEALTQYLGFPYYGDEYKVMGLAPYGKPAYINEMRKIVRLHDAGDYALNLDYFRHHREKIVYEWDDGAPVVGELFSPLLEKLLGPRRHKDEEIKPRHKDIACSVQAMYEEAFFHLLNTLHDTYGSDYLTLAGGCAMNSVANGKIYRKSPFKKVYIQPAAGDAGGAIGAAFYTWFQQHPERPRDFVMRHASWGPEFSRERIKTLLDENRDQIDNKHCMVRLIKDEGTLCAQTARAVADGKVVGWFQGRMEWGPRALGNRSIVCDPRRADMKDILNRKIKRRESFRPFAPSILREEVSHWFEEEDDVPFMMMVFQIREVRRHQVPAVTHVDGSGRLQTVTPDQNPRYYSLIREFNTLTGIPMLLNTSFNENEPIVCTPEEALECFLRTDMDVLVLNDYFLSRQTN
jgi:carbamoyltransferase